MKKISAIIGACLLLLGCWGSAFGQQVTVSQALNIIIAAGKSLTISNTLTLAGTDGSTLNVSTGGTLGTAAFQNTGTSGATVPLLNGTNTWANAQTYSGNIIGNAAASVNTTLGIGTTIGGTIRQTQIVGAGQATSALTDAGNTGGTVYIQDSGAGANNGGALLFGASQGYFAAFKALLTDGAAQSAGVLAVSTRVSSSNTNLTEAARWSANGDFTENAQMFVPNITTTSAAQTGTVCWTTGTGKFTVDTTVGCLASIGAAKNILSKPTPGDALAIVSRLEPVSFKYKAEYGDGGRYEQFGLIAEQVAAVDERLAGRDTVGTLTGVRYQELTAVLAGAIQALKSENAELRERLDKLERTTRASAR